MSSIFGSLQNVNKALQAQQAAIQTTGHNIANANTEGYSRQRVNLTPSMPFPSPGWNAPAIPGQMGTGVEAGSIQRIRDDFTDIMVRHETNQNGYWGAKSDALSQMENIMNEPTDQGLSSVLDQFWQSLQDFAANPDNDGAKSVVRQRGQAVADTFNYLSTSLGNISGNLKQQIDVNVDQVNSLANRINDLNKEIAKIEPNGYVANDLYDQRDLMVDQLSALTNVKVTAVPSGGQAKPEAVGKYTIELLDKNGQSLGTLVDGNTLTASKLSVSYGGTSSQPTVDFALGGTALASQSMFGKLQGLADSYTQDFPDMQSKLDNMAQALANEINTVHKQSGANIDFFSGVNAADSTSAAQTIKVSQQIIDDIDNLHGGAVGGPAGDHSIAQAMADVVGNNSMTFEDGSTATLKSYLQGAIGDMGVNSQAAKRLADNTATLQQTAENRRASTSGVSIDEEMTNLIQYQHAYGAAARMVSVINDMLDTIVNRMGV
jgi:flagellar hook-associated protein 1 FlgK